MYKKIFGSDILFSGYYGQLNMGDDAFVEVASWGAKKYWNKKNNKFLAKQCNLPETKTEARGYPLTIPKTYKFQNKLLLSETDYLISAGGSTIHSELNLDNIKKIAVDNKKCGGKVKIGGIGVSIGPFKTSKDELATVEYLKSIDFLAVRDQASFDFVSSLHLPYQAVNAFDLAALLPYIYGLKKVKNTSERKIIGVSVCPYESITDIKKMYKENERHKKTVELLKHLDSKNDIHFKFFIVNGNQSLGDLELTYQTINSVLPKSYEVIPYTLKTNDAWTKIASCDFMIATRLHAAIFACFSDTPFVLNEYHRKCSDFLNDIGYDEKLRLFNNDYNPKEKAEMISDILMGDKYIFPQHTKKMINRAILNFTGVNL